MLAVLSDGDTEPEIKAEEEEGDEIKNLKRTRDEDSDFNPEEEEDEEIENENQSELQEELDDLLNDSPLPEINQELTQLQPKPKKKTQPRVINEISGISAMVETIHAFTKKVKKNNRQTNIIQMFINTHDSTITKENILKLQPTWNLGKRAQKKHKPTKRLRTRDAYEQEKVIAYCENGQEDMEINETLNFNETDVKGWDAYSKRNELKLFASRRETNDMRREVQTKLMGKSKIHLFIQEMFQLGRDSIFTRPQIQVLLDKHDVLFNESQLTRIGEREYGHTLPVLLKLGESFQLNPFYFSESLSSI